MSGVPVWPIKRIILGLVVVVLAALYFTGSLDNVLYKVGLNYHRCGENGFGAVFCGSALAQYNRRIDAAEQQVRALTQTTTTASSSAPYVAASAYGTVSAKTLPDSTQAQATFTVKYTCASTETSCVWYGEAAQYPKGTLCPGVFDTSRVMWTGSVQSAAGTETASVAYQPNPGPDKACIYAHDATTAEDHLAS